MVNFRGFCDKTIDFQDKSVVLLSAANGIGKTTTVDAIEWCLTGNIGRLKTAFDTRSTNGDERRMNTRGILKNRDAGAKAKVKVILWLLDGEKERILCREQTKDELNPELSKIMIDKNEEMAKAFIQEYVGDSFYNFHFCDVQKAINVQSRKRKDLKDFFGEFITNYDEQKQIAENLDIFAEDVERYIEDKGKQKVPQEVIKNYEEQLKKAYEDAKVVSYPQTIFYPDEKKEITDLNKEELRAQKAEVENCGYHIVKEELCKLVENEALKSRQSVIKKIISCWETKGESIQRAVNVGFSKNMDTITIREKKLRKLGDGRISGIKRGEISLSDDDYYLADTQEPYSFRQVTWEDILRIMEEYSKNGYLPPIFSKGTVIWLSEEYEGDSKTSRFYYPMQLPPWKSLQMIRKLDCWYADTDLDRREYAEEYQRIVSGILHGLVILNPKKLALEEVIKEWEVNFTEPEKRGYRVVFDEIRKGKIPIVRDCNYITD